MRRHGLLRRALQIRPADASSHPIAIARGACRMAPIDPTRPIQKLLQQGGDPMEERTRARFSRPKLLQSAPSRRSVLKAGVATLASTAVFAPAVLRADNLV